ncbi:MFS transporter [Candidatus Peregrinibacteria bacterium]|nr:MAG: MFS transporter [Candidatus Peregrinibacteria bacterium]
MNQEKPFRSFFLFLLLIFFWCTFFGGLKFLMTKLASGNIQSSPEELLEHIAAWISMGTIVAYLIGGSLANHFTKRTLLFFVSFATIGILLVEFFFGFSHLSVLLWGMAGIGLLYGIFAILRTIITYIEIVKTQLPDTTVNGIATITFILSAIIGSFLGNYLHEQFGSIAFWIFLLFLVTALGVIFFLRYESFEHHRPFGKSFPEMFRDVSWIAERAWVLLLASSALWAISTAVSLKAIPYASEKFDIQNSTATLIVLCSALGAALGNALTVRIQRRWLAFRIFSYTFAVLVFLFQIVTNSFFETLGYAFVIGVCMGAATNIADATYLSFIGKNHKKENGAALQGGIINIFLVVILLFLPKEQAFSIMGIGTAVLILLVRLKLSLVMCLEK